jgi:hypothetical protein
MFKTIVRKLLQPINNWADLSTEIAEIQKSQTVVTPVTDHQKPQFPLSYIIEENDNGKFCPTCCSSLRSNWYGKIIGCIQPKCSNYYGGPK